MTKPHNKQITGKPVLIGNDLFVQPNNKKKKVKVNDGQAVLFHKILENQKTMVDGDLVHPTVSISGIFQQEKLILVSEEYNQMHKGEVHIEPMKIGKKSTHSNYQMIVS